MRNKSKIEKLVIYYDEILGKDRDVRILDMANKIDEIIDHLNSQAQPEEKEMTKEDIEYLEKKREKEIQEGVAWLKQQEKEKMIPIKDEDINVGKLKELASDNYGKDTPEEWEEELLDLEVSDDWTARRSLRNAVDKECARLIVDFIKQLLDEGEREVRKQERMIRLHKRVGKEIDNLEEPYKSFAKAGAGII